MQARTNLRELPPRMFLLLVLKHLFESIEGLGAGG